MMLAVWLLLLPLRLLAALGLRRSVILACLFVLAVTAYGVAEDLGVLDPPARAAPAPKAAAGQPRPSQAAVADIPAVYLRLYRQAGATYRVPWPVLPGLAGRSSPGPRPRRRRSQPGPVGRQGSPSGAARGRPAAGRGATATRRRRSSPPPAAE
jgi:hypothetical protein